MRTIGEDRGHEGRGLRADGRRPLDEARRGPLEMVLMGLGHVGGIGGVAAPRVITRVGRDALAAMQGFDRRGADADLDDLVDQLVRDRVVVVVHLDVVIDVHAGPAPLAVDEGLGGQRPEDGLVQALEQLLAASPVAAHAPGIELREQLGDAGVERPEGKEGLVAKPRQDPPLGDLHGHFDLRLVPRARGPRRQDGGAVVGGKFLVRALQARLVAAGEDDAALELIAHDGTRDAAEEGEGPGVAGDPVRDLLGPRGLGVGVVGGAEGGDEQLHLDDLARGGIDEVRLLAGVVDEALLTGTMDLSHGQAAALQPAAVEVAEPRVAVAVGVLLQVFQVEQLQGDPGLAALGVDPGAVGRGTLPLAGHGRPAVELALEPVVGQRLDLGPVQAGGPGAREHAGDRAQPQPEAAGHGPVTEPQGPLLAKDFPGLPHGQSLGRHRAPFGWGADGALGHPASPAEAPAPFGVGSPVHDQRSTCSPSRSWRSP